MMMMTTTEAQLAGPLQALVDSRLDTIERMLMGRLPRRERLAIVREVEAQIFELLQERERPDEEPTRDDVLAVLARLDPPEAYMEEMTEGMERGPRRTPPSRAFPASRKNHSHTAKASGILGLVVFALVLLSPMGYVIGMPLNSELVIIGWWFGTIFLVGVGGLLSIVLAVISRLKGTWPVVGLVTSGFSMFCAFLGLVWMAVVLRIFG